MDPKNDSPYYEDPQKGTLNLGKNPCVIEALMFEFSETSEHCLFEG